MARPSAADRIADLTAEVEQQRTRAEAAEAELSDAHKLIATMESTDELVAKQRAEVEAALAGMRSRFDATHRILMRMRAEIAMDCERRTISDLALAAAKALTGEGSR